jgi:BolA protein
MMTTADRMAVIQRRLQEIFSPSHLEVLDDSAKHVGHEGSKSGAGHYTVIIAAESFENKSRVDVHREIYAALQDLIPGEIHALRIKIISST